MLESSGGVGYTGGATRRGLGSDGGGDLCPSLREMIGKWLKPSGVWRSHCFTRILRGGLGGAAGLVSIPVAALQQWLYRGIFPGLCEGRFMEGREKIRVDELRWAAFGASRKPGGAEMWCGLCRFKVSADLQVEAVISLSRSVWDTQYVFYMLCSGLHRWWFAI